jgi:hypothetical protein
MMSKFLIPNISLVIRTILISCAVISSTLPGLAQTTIRTTVKRPTIVYPVRQKSPTNFNSRASISQSSSACFQVDANSKIYVRSKSGGIRYYPTNSSSSYARTIMGYSHCN